MAVIHSRSTIGALVAILVTTTGSLVLTATVPAQSQQSNQRDAIAPVATTAERVELIMGGLPPRGSASYAELEAAAGSDLRIQILHLTHCEMWSVHSNRLESLRAVAASNGISVKSLDETWNDVLAPMGHAPMDEAAMAMMSRANQSKATAGVSVMAARAANMVEFALTKGMHDKTISAQPARIRIAVNADTTVTALRRSVVVDGDRLVWRGVVEGTENPVTLLWWGSGRITGTISMGDKLFQMKWLGADTIGVVESMMDRMPDEHPKTSPKRMQDMKMQADTVFKHGDASAGRPRRNAIEHLQDDSVTGASLPKTLHTALKKAIDAAPDAVDNSHVVIDVMIAYTAKAAAHYGDIRRDLLDLAIEEANQSFRSSRIDGISLRLVHVHETDYDEAGAEHFDHVWRMVDLGDGHLEELPRLRDRVKADIVVLVVDDPSGCGLATRVAASAEEAYAVVHHECAATSYSVAHEVGHLLGARHDRSLDQGGAPFAYGHGYVSPDLKWRTMMSYKAGCNNCPRLPLWSTPAPVMQGRPAGDENNDNARVIRERAAHVAAFR